MFCPSRNGGTAFRLCGRLPVRSNYAPGFMMGKERSPTSRKNAATSGNHTHLAPTRPAYSTGTPSGCAPGAAKYLHWVK
jgi:hypothetical protein